MFLRYRILAPTLAALVALEIMGCSTPPSTGSSSSSSAPAPSAPAPQLTALTRSLHPLARHDLDVGRRDPSVLTAGSIYFKPSAAQRADRDALVAAVQDPASPSYHKWLSVEEYAARFGARQEDIARVTQWLKSQGLAIDGPSRIGTRIGFRGTGGQVESAFQTEIHNYDVSGQTHYAMASAPMIPSELAPVVLGLHGFHDFRLHHPVIRHPLHPSPVAQPGSIDPIYGETALGPADFEVLYDTAPLTATGTIGTGVNLVIIGETYFNPADVASFRSNFNITGVNEVDVVVPNTGTQAVNSSGDEGETELDLEWSSAVAPGANIIFVYTGNDKTNFSVDDSVAYAVEEGANLVPGVGNGAAQIISESYGGCDADYVGSDADVDGEIAAAANLEGITYVAASGDSGAAGCLDEGFGGLYTGPPADMPGVTGVGGTEFCGGTLFGGCNYSGAAGANVQTAPYFVNQLAVEYPQALGVSLEGVWNDSYAAQDYNSAGGGGASTVWAKPSYQSGVAGMPNDGARDVPDVALTASPNNVGYLVWEPTELEDGGKADTLGVIGGTSASTPSFAGILARVNQAVAANGAPLGLGNVNPQLYALFANNGQLGAFHDIVTGDNISPCDPSSPRYPDCPIPDGGVPEGGLLEDGGKVLSSYGGYSAHPGYDLASGLGSVDAAKLVAAWVGLTPTTTSLTAPAAAGVGAPVTLSATITSTSALTTSAVRGSVTFAFLTLTGDAGAPYSFDAGGGADESWVLGTSYVTPVAGSPEKATATLSAAIPPGLYGQAYLVAEYSGDTHYLASNSSPAAFISVTGSTLQVVPAAITLPPNGQTTFTITGGAPGVTWGIEGTDTSCVTVKHKGVICSQLATLSPTSALFQAGGQDGQVNVVAVDTLGEEALVVVTVSGAAVDAGVFPTIDDAGPAGGPVSPPPFSNSDDAGESDDAGTPTEAGTDGAAPTDAATDSGSSPVDAASTDAATDSGSAPVDAASDDATTAPPDAGSDASASEDSGPVLVSGDAGGLEDGGLEDGGSAANAGGGGCGCVVAGAEHSGAGSSGAGLGGLLLGLAVITRRRSRRG